MIYDKTSLHASCLDRCLIDEGVVHALRITLFAMLQPPKYRTRILQSPEFRTRKEKKTNCSGRSRPLCPQRTSVSVLNGCDRGGTFLPNQTISGRRSSSIRLNYTLVSVCIYSWGGWGSNEFLPFVVVKSNLVILF